MHINENGEHRLMNKNKGNQTIIYKVKRKKGMSIIKIKKEMKKTKKVINERKKK